MHDPKRRHDEMLLLKFGLGYDNKVVGLSGVRFIEVRDVGLGRQHPGQYVIHHLSKRGIKFRSRDVIQLPGEW